MSDKIEIGFVKLTPAAKVKMEKSLNSLNEVDNFNVDNILGCAIKAKARIQFMLLMLQVGRIEKAEESLNKALLHLNRIISYNNKTSN